MLVRGRAGIQQWQLQLEEAGTLLNNMGYYLDEIGNYEQALPLYQEASEILTKVLGEQHPSTQTIKRNYLRCLSKSKKRWWEFWK